MPDARRCGSCTACCPLMDHLKAELGEDRRPCGCRPFPGRKAGCGGFVCLWLDGFGEPSDRPDKLGVVLKAVEDRTVRSRWRGKSASVRPRSHGRFSSSNESPRVSLPSSSNALLTAPRGDASPHAYVHEGASGCCPIASPADVVADEL